MAGSAVWRLRHADRTVGRPPAHRSSSRSRLPTPAQPPLPAAHGRHRTARRSLSPSARLPATPQPPSELAGPRQRDVRTVPVVTYPDGAGPHYRSHAPALLPWNGAPPVRRPARRVRSRRAGTEPDRLRAAQPAQRRTGPQIPTVDCPSGRAPRRPRRDLLRRHGHDHRSGPRPGRPPRARAPSSAGCSTWHVAAAGQHGRGGMEELTKARPAARASVTTLEQVEALILQV